MTLSNLVLNYQLISSKSRLKNNLMTFVRIETVNGSHYLTPIEFEALGGKQHDWKRNLRVAETNKIVREGILAAGLVKPCPKGCTCENCVLAKQQPINLEKLIDAVYSPTASPQKSSNNSSPVKPGEEDSEEVSEELPPTPPDSARSRDQSESPGAPPVDQVCLIASMPHLTHPRPTGR